MEKVNHNDSPDRAWQAKNWIALIAVAFFILIAPMEFSMDVSVKPISDKLKLQASETRWIKLGSGFRGTGLWVENQNSGNLGGGFNVDNARLCLNGQFHQYLKFEVNSECYFCDNTAFQR